MFGLILLLVICGFVALFMWRIDGAIAIMCSALLFVLFLMPAVSLTGGLIDDYSVGSRDGYITKISNKGIVWKTNEGEMQVGTGNMAALQEPFEFSVINSTILPALEAAADDGQRVRVNYTQYLIANWRHAESSYVVLSVERLDEEEG